MKPRTSEALSGKNLTPSKEAGLVLAYFSDFAEQSEETLAAFLKHCGITSEDLQAAPTTKDAILTHYRLANGHYELERAAYDLSRWPPIAERIRELKRERQIGV
jgi:hypothetical protein